MRQSLKILVAMALVLGMMGGALAATETYQIDSLTDSSGSTYGTFNNFYYQEVTPKEDVKLETVNLFDFYEGSYCDTIQVRDTSGNTLTSTSVGTDKADFGGYQLTSGTTYRIGTSDCDGRQEASTSESTWDFAKLTIDEASGDQVQVWHTITITPNQAPQFNSTSVTPDPPLIGENVSYSAEVYDSDGSISHTNLTVTYGGSTVVNDDKKTGTTPSWPDIYKPTTGDKWLNATFETVDDAGAVTTATLNRYLSDTAPNVTINEPDSSVKSSNTVSWNVTTKAADSNPNEALDLKIYKNGNLENTYSITEGDTKNGSLTYSDGTGQTFKAEVVESDGDKDTETVTFDVDTTKPVLNVQKPSGDLKKKKNLKLNYTISDPHLDTSSCEYSKDAGTKLGISNCENTTVTFNTIGSHNVTVYGSDTLGHTSSDTTTFTTDYENRIKLEDKDSGSSIQDFEVTFTNGSASAGGSTTDGQYEIYTSELPTGSVNMTLKATAYTVKNVSLTVDKSFELRKTYKMERAGLTIDTFDAQSGADIQFNFTAKNTTTSFNKTNITLFKKDYKDFSSIGFPTGDVTVTVEDYKGDRKSRTYYLEIEENSKLSLEAYLLKSGEGIYTNVEVYDPNQDALENALVTIYRSYSGTWKQVAQRKTTTSGGTSFYTDPDVVYKIIASKQGYDPFVGTFDPVNYQYDALMIQLGSSGGFEFSTRWDKVSYKLEPEAGKLNRTKYNFTWTVTDSLSDLTEYGVKLYNTTGGLVNTTKVTTNPSGGEVSVSHNLSKFEDGKEFLVTGYFVSDGKTYELERYYRVKRKFGGGLFALDEILSDFKNGTESSTQGFLSLMASLAVGFLAGRSKFGRKGAGAATVITLGIFTLQGLFPSFIFLVTLLTLIGALTLR